MTNDCEMTELSFQFPTKKLCIGNNLKKLESTHTEPTPFELEKIRRDNERGVYCVCKRKESTLETEDVMIECEHCNDWLHGRCIKLDQRAVEAIEIYYCPRCQSESRQIECNS